VEPEVLIRGQGSGLPNQVGQFRADEFKAEFYGSVPTVVFIASPNLSPLYIGE
jgi:hypothetical protein